MKKPVLPVDEKWVLPVNTTIEKASIDFVSRSTVPFTNKEIAILGEFGNFNTIKFDGRFYIMPIQVIQWLLWSFEHKVDNQFSSEERLKLCGFVSKSDIEQTLRHELESLKNHLEKSENLIVRSINTEQIEDNFDGCPEPLFFDEVT